MTYAVLARPRYGIAEMVASVHATEAEADAERVRQEDRRGDYWEFTVTSVREDDEISD